MNIDLTSVLQVVGTLGASGLGILLYKFYRAYLFTKLVQTISQSDGPQTVDWRTGPNSGMTYSKERSQHPMDQPQQIIDYQKHGNHDHANNKALPPPQRSSLLHRAVKLPRTRKKTPPGTGRSGP